MLLIYPRISCTSFKAPLTCTHSQFFQQMAFSQSDLGRLLLKRPSCYLYMIVSLTQLGARQGLGSVGSVSGIFVLSTRWSRVEGRGNGRWCQDLKLENGGIKVLVRTYSTWVPHKPWQGLKLVQPIWKTVWHYLLKLNVCTESNSTPMYITHRKECVRWPKTCNRMSLAALFIWLKTRNHPNAYQQQKRSTYY